MRVVLILFTIIYRNSDIFSNSIRIGVVVDARLILMFLIIFAWIFFKSLNINFAFFEILLEKFGISPIIEFWEDIPIIVVLVEKWTKILAIFLIALFFFIN